MVLVLETCFDGCQCCRNLEYAFDCDGLTLQELREGVSCRCSLAFLSHNDRWLSPWNAAQIACLTGKNQNVKCSSLMLPTLSVDDDLDFA